MPTTKRQQIVSAIDTRLKTILVSGGFESDLGRRVFEWRATPLSESELPGLIYRDTEERGSLTIGWQLRSLTVEIEAITSGADASAVLRNKLIPDIERAVGVDLTWGALAEDTRIVSETIEVDHQERLIAGVLIRMEIDYRTGIFDPYS